MPISAIDGCTEAHWSDVLDILSEAIEDAGFTPNLVSNADEVGIIHKRIIQNLYDNPIVVCDVSGKNPNVMFELGLRLAFDKPTIIVKDDKTSYSFDTSAIEHLEYPRDLRFSKIVDFKENLSDKIQATYEKATTDSSYTTFLKHFGEFKVAKIDKKEISGQEYILEELNEIRSLLYRRESRHDNNDKRNHEIVRRRHRLEKDIDICMKGQDPEVVKELAKDLSGHLSISEVTVHHRGENHKHLMANVMDDEDISAVEEMVSRELKQRGVEGRLSIRGKGM